MQIVASLRTRIAQHRQYARTLAELQDLPAAIKRDLDIEGREIALARKAVYGA